MKSILRISVIAALCLLTACGYHLRGSIALPEQMKTMYVFGASSALHTETQQLLRSSKSQLVKSPNEAGVVIKILKEDIRNRVLSVGTTGKSSEMELSYYLRFQFYDKKEQPMMDEQVIELTREFFNDQTAILAKENEEIQIRKEIYKQAARMMIARAQIAVENQTH